MCECIKLLNKSHLKLLPFLFFYFCVKSFDHYLFIGLSHADEAPNNYCFRVDDGQLLNTTCIEKSEEESRSAQGICNFFKVLAEMKGGNNYRLRGRNLSLTLAVLIVTTIALWAWEKNPFSNTLPSAQERYIIPSSGLLCCFSLIKKKKWFVMLLFNRISSVA